MPALPPVLGDVPPLDPSSGGGGNHLLLAILAATAFLVLCVLGAWRRHRARRRAEG